MTTRNKNKNKQKTDASALVFLALWLLATALNLDTGEMLGQLVKG